MSVTFGRNSTFWILFIWSLYLSPSIGQPQKVYEKECQGTANDFRIHPLDNFQRYKALKEMYKNCTFVRTNLEIVGFSQNGAKHNFNFLSTIREVNGYVLITDNWLDQIRLPGLRVIRGSERLTFNENHHDISLVVGWNFNSSNRSIGLQELKLTSLVEITNGNVFFSHNPTMCFGETTIDWKSITQNNPMGKVDYVGTQKTSICNESCHEKCARNDSRFCWAVGRDDKPMCQAERPCGDCRRNCSENNCTCHSECIGGCTGSNASSCVTCKNFLRGDECVVNCSASKNNSDTSEWENPPTTYMLGMRCVPECPEPMLIQGDVCVTACANGYKENKTNTARTCIPCLENCPKTCKGTTDQWFLDFRSIEEFRQCKIVDGHLIIVSRSFTEKQIVGEPTFKSGALKLSDLEILKDVQEITGYVEVDAQFSNLSSLSFLRNLRIIGGYGNRDDSLIIRNTELTELNFKSLKQIRTGNVLIHKNPKLCYVRTVNWTRILTNTKTRQRAVIKNANSTMCKEHSCSAVCSDFGCWGPGDDNCVYSGE